MWVMIDEAIVDTKCIKISGRCIVVNVSESEHFVRQYDDKEDCERALSLFAKSIKTGETFFIMPTQEELKKVKFEEYSNQVQIEPVADKVDAQEAVNLWNSLEQYGFKPVSRISNSSTRYKSLVARLREYSIEEYEKAIENIKKSELLRKNADKWFNFDWFIKPNNFPKVLDGNYNTAEDRIDEEQVKWWEE